MTERELTPGDVQDARAIAKKLRASGFIRVASMDAARTIERLADAYEQRVARHEALVAALAVDHGAEHLGQGGGT